MKLKDFLDYNEKKLIKPIHYHLNFAPAIEDVDQDICDYFEAHYTEKKLKDFYENNSGLIKTPFRSEKSGLDILISIYRKRGQEKFVIGAVYATKFTYFAVRRMQAFYDLKEMIGIDKHPNQLFNDFENFFENGCLADTLEQLNNHDGNIVLPTNFKKDDNRVMAIFRDNSDPFPKKFLSHFRVVATDEKSELGKFAILYESSLRDLKETLDKEYSTEQLSEIIEDFFNTDNIDNIKGDINLYDAHFLSGIDLRSFTGYAIDLQFEKNAWCAVEKFGSISVPPYIVYFREKIFSQSAGIGNFSSRINRDEKRFQELADLINKDTAPSELEDKFDKELDRYDEDLLEEAKDRPLYLDTPFQTPPIIDDKPKKLSVKARIDEVHYKGVQCILRGFTIIPDDSELGKFATCFIDRFQDLRAMLNPDKPLHELIYEYSEGFSLTKEDINYDENFITLETPFETEYGKISAYFERCSYYGGNDTPFILQFFYISDFKSPQTDDSKLYDGLKSLYGLKLPKRSDTIMARFLMYDSKFYEANGGAILEYLIQSQRKLIIEQRSKSDEQEKTKNAETKRKEEKQISIDRMQKMVERYTHSLGNTIIPETIYNVAVRLKQHEDEDMNKDSLLLYKAYRSEEMIKIQAELLRNKYLSSDPEEFRRSVRKDRMRPESTDPKVRVMDILNNVTESVFADRLLNQNYAKLNSIREQLAFKHGRDIDEMHEEFEQQMFFTKELSPLEWVNQTLCKIQLLENSDLWKKVRLRKGRHAEALLYDYFSELMFNALKYADHRQRDFLKVRFGERKIRDKQYLFTEWENSFVPDTQTKMGTGNGLMSIAEDLKDLNDSVSEEESLQKITCENTFQVTLMFEKYLFIPNPPIRKDLGELFRKLK